MRHALVRDRSPVDYRGCQCQAGHSLGLASSDLALQVPQVTWQDDIPGEEAADQEHRRRPKGDLGYCNHPIIHTIKDATSAP